MHNLTAVNIQVGDILLFRGCHRVECLQDDSGTGPLTLVRVTSIGEDFLGVRDDVFPRTEGVDEKGIPKVISTLKGEDIWGVDILRVPTANEIMREIESFAQTMRNSAGAAKAHDQKLDPEYFVQWSEYILRLTQYWKFRGRHLAKEVYAEKQSA